MNHIKYLCFLVSFCVFGQLAFAQNAYQITVALDDYKNDTLLLGYRMGSGMYIEDTLVGANDKGQFVFTGKESLPGGVYIIVTKPKNRYFEFLIANEEEQKNLKLKTAAGNEMSKNLKIENSPENDIFMNYIKFLNTQKEKGDEINAYMTEAKNMGDQAKADAYQKELDALQKKLETRRDELYKKHPKSLAMRLIRASQMPEVPKELQVDRKQAFLYYRAHFFDNMYWDDDRLIRTPVYRNKIEQYINKLTVQTPDSVIIGVEHILNLVKKGGNEKMMEYTTSHFLNTYAKTKTICMDAVYVHIGKKYFCENPKSRDWVKEEQLEKICEDVQTLEPLRCGEVAPNFRLRTLEDKSITLHELDAPYTIVYFWDPDCGNCTKNSKKLVPIYNKWKDKGVEIIGVCSKTWKDVDECKKKVKDLDIKWVNVSENGNILGLVKRAYDIKVNPYIYMLDKDKKIMWKRLDPQQVDNILEREFNPENQEK